MFLCYQKSFALFKNQTSFISNFMTFSLSFKSFVAKYIVFYSIKHIYQETNSIKRNMYFNVYSFKKSIRYLQQYITDASLRIPYIFLWGHKTNLIGDKGKVFLRTYRKIVCRKVGPKTTLNKLPHSNSGPILVRSDR